MNETRSPLKDMLRGEPYRAAVVLFLAGLLALTWKFFGSHGFYLEHLREWPLTSVYAEVNAAVYRFGSCFLLLGLVPALVVTFLFRQSLGEYGVCLGRWRAALVWNVVTIPVFIALAYVGAGDPEYQAVYPVNPRAGASAGAFALHALTYFVFYLGWEFFFRGFILFGLEKPLGAAAAVVAQAVLSAMMHIGDPASEAFGGFFVGLVWGFAVLRTRSLLASLPGHAALGIALDYFLSRS